MLFYERNIAIDIISDDEKESEKSETKNVIPVPTKDDSDVEMAIISSSRASITPS